MLPDNKCLSGCVCESDIKGCRAKEHHESCPGGARWVLHAQPCICRALQKASYVEICFWVSKCRTVQQKCARFDPLSRSYSASNGNMQPVKWHVAGSSMGSTQDAHAGATAAVPHLHVQSVQPASCHSQPRHKNVGRCCCDPCCIASPSAESCQVADTPPAINGHVSSPKPSAMPQCFAKEL